MTARERTIRWEDPLAAAQAARELSGLDALRAMLAGRLPNPPILETIGFDAVEVEEGRMVFALEPDESLYNPIGSIHGGVAATLLDSAMGCAVHSTLPAGRGYTTIDLHVRYLRPMSTTTGRVLAEGVVTHRGRTLVTAEGRVVVEETGKVIATATTSCVLL